MKKTLKPYQFIKTVIVWGEDRYDPDLDMQLAETDWGDWELDEFTADDPEFIRQYGTVEVDEEDNND